MKRNDKKRQWLILFWLVFFAGLLIAANKLPLLTEVETPRSLNYSHPYDHYTLAINGTWQVYKAKKQSLTLVDLKNDSTLDFTLEVGGIDDMSLAACAKKTMAVIAEEQQITFDPDSIAVADGQEKGIRFTGTATEGSKAYIEEFFIYHPNEGLRFYAVYTHPEGTPENKILVAETIVGSVAFTDFNQIYADYLH
ncbi:MAG TPA: hypothetical protein PKD52_05095 [Clostridiales bacterium]|nr:hypothetical protein [Clostridiales bacterium]